MVTVANSRAVCFSLICPESFFSWAYATEKKQVTKRQIDTTVLLRNIRTNVIQLRMIDKVQISLKQLIACKSHGNQALYIGKLLDKCR